MFGITRAACAILNRHLKPFLHYLADGEFKESKTLVAFPLKVRLSSIAAAPSHVNELLESFHAPIRLKLCRVGELSFGVQLSVKPIFVMFRSIDIILALQSDEFRESSAFRMFKADFLFWDTAMRLARREFVSRHVSVMRESIATESFTFASFKKVAWSWLSLVLLFLICLAINLVNILVRIDIIQVSARFEDSVLKPHTANCLGSGFAMHACIDSISTVSTGLVPFKAWKPLFRRRCEIANLRFYYDSGLSRSSNGYISRQTLAPYSDLSASENHSSQDYLPLGLSPILQVSEISVDVRIAGDSTAPRTELIFNFSDDICISLSEVDFQTGLASILRIVRCLASKLALGASVDSLPSNGNHHDRAPDVKAEIARKHASEYELSISSGFLRRDVFKLENDLSLHDALVLRARAEEHDLLGICCRSADSEGDARIVLQRLLRAFSRDVLCRTEHGIHHAIVGCSVDAEKASPSLVLSFRFPNISVKMRRSISSVRVSPRLHCKLSGLKIDVYDCVARGAVVVAMCVRDFLVMNDKDEAVIRTFPRKQSNFLDMRFKKDGILSPAPEYLYFAINSVEVFVTPDDLKVILEFYVPVESSRDHVLRKRVLKTLATARRRRAVLSSTPLPWRALEQATSLNIALRDIGCHAANTTVAAGFFLSEKLGLSRQHAPNTPTCVVRFSEISIVSQKPPLYRISQRQYYLDESPVGVPLSEAHNLDPSISQVPSDSDGEDYAGDGYNGDDQVTSLSMFVRDLSIDFVTGVSGIRAIDERVMSDAWLSLTVVYIGAPFTVPLRTDSYIDVFLGEGIRMLAESLVTFSSVVTGICGPIFELVDRFLAIDVHPTTLLESRLIREAVHGMYGARHHPILASIPTTSDLRRSLKRLCGDVHVLIRKSKLMLVQPSADAQSRRIFLFLNFEDSYVRACTYTSMSSRLLIELRSMNLELGRDVSTKRSFLLSPNTITVHLSKCLLSHTLSSSSVASFKTRAHIASEDIQMLADLSVRNYWIDVVSLTKAVVCSRSSDSIPFAKTLEDFSNETNEGQPELDVLECDEICDKFKVGFYLLFACDGLQAELGLCNEQNISVGLVPRGDGVRLARVDTLDETWFQLRCQPQCDEQSSAFLTADIASSHVVASCGNLGDESKWRFQGSDPNHFAIQHYSGQFLGVNADNRRCLLSSITSYFGAQFGPDMPAPRSDELFDAGTISSLEVFATAPSFNFTLGGTKTVGENSSASVSTNDILLLRFGSPVICKVIGDTKHDGITDMEVNVWSKLSVLWNGPSHSRSGMSSPVIYPLPFFMSFAQNAREDTRRFVFHGGNLKVLISSRMVLKLVSAYRQTASVSDEDMSHFYFYNHTDETLYLVVSGSDTAASRSSLTVRPLARVPFDFQQTVLARPDSNHLVSPWSSLLSSNKASQIDLRAENDYYLSVSTDNDSFSKAFIGAAGVQKVQLQSLGGPAKTFILKTVEDEGVSAVEVHAYSTVSVRNRLLCAASVWAKSALSQQLSLRGTISNEAEIGIDVDEDKGTFAVAIGGVHLTEEVSISAVRQAKHGSMFVDCNMRLDGPQSNAPLLRQEPLASQCFHIPEMLRRKRRISLHYTRMEEERGVVTCVPFMSFKNNTASGLDIVLDDGHFSSSTTIGHLVPWVRRRLHSASRLAFSRDYLVFAFNVQPGARFTNDCPSHRGSYRLSVRDIGGAWAEWIHFSIGSNSSSFHFAEIRKIDSGFVNMVGICNDWGGIEVSVHPKHTVRNLVPGLVLRMASTITRVYGNPAPARVASKALVEGLRRHNDRRVIFDIRPDELSYFNEDEAYVGVGTQWARRSLHFPRSTSETTHAHIPPNDDFAGLRLVAKKFDDGEIKILPLVLITNLLDVRICVHGGGMEHSVDVPARSSRPYHPPYYRLEGILRSGQRMRISAQGVFAESGGIYPRESGTYPIAVRLLRGATVAVPALQTSSAIISNKHWILGVDVFAQGDGYQVIRILPAPRYGPTFRIFNHSQEIFCLTDNPHKQDPVCVVSPQSAFAYFSWTSVMRPRQRLFLTMVNEQSSRNRYREVSLASRGRSDTNSIAEFDAVLTFPHAEDDVASAGAEDENDKYESSSFTRVGIRLGPGNGFMRDFHLYILHRPESRLTIGSSSARIRESDSVVPQGAGKRRRKEPVPSRSATESKMAEMMNLEHRRTCIHVCLAEALLTVQSFEEKLLTLILCNVHEEVFVSDLKLWTALYVSSFRIENCTRMAYYKVVVDRDDQDESCDQRDFAVKVISSSRIPHSNLNPTDLIHFEHLAVDISPIVVNVESYFIDLVGLFVVRIFHVVGQSPPSSSKATRTPIFAAHTTVAAHLLETVSFTTSPVFFESACISTVSICLTYRQNGRVNVGIVDADAYKKLIPGLRLALTLIPSIRDARLRLRGPDLSHTVHVSGQLTRKLGAHYIRKILASLRSILPNISVIRLLEGLLLGRQRGPDNLRRFGRAKTFLKRKVSHNGIGEKAFSKIQFIAPVVPHPHDRTFEQGDRPLTLLATYDINRNVKALDDLFSPTL